MPIDGRYEGELKTMMGSQPFGLELKTDGKSLSGNIDGNFGNQSFSGGTVDGNNLTVNIKLQSPLGVMNLAVTATVDGDSIEGQVVLGSFRPTPFKGHRA